MNIVQYSHTRWLQAARPAAAQQPSVTEAYQLLKYSTSCYLLEINLNSALL